MTSGAKIHLILSILLISSMSTSCFKKQEYPIEPSISYDSFNVIADSASIIFNFTDGDGDLGLADNDTTSPYNPNSEYYYNIYMYYFEKDDALGWVNGKALNGDTIIFKYRIEPIAVKGKSKSIKGKMNIDLGNLYYNSLSDQSDTIKYSIQLIDKALHKSNIIESEEIIR